MSLEWLIVGGGVHGVHLATRLISEASVAEERIAIVDPADRLLARWRSCTAVTGMRYLRSPGVHHLDAASSSLRQYAGKHRLWSPGLFAEPNQRPSLRLFNAHCDHLVSKLGLSELHRCDRAVECIADDRSVVVRLAKKGWVETRNVIFALGAGDQPYWPKCAPRKHPKVRHVFDPGFDGWPSGSSERVVVMGGGISAAQVALRLLGEGHRVRLITRHKFRVHQFDSDPVWLGPRVKTEFNRFRNASRRREIISKARHRGSIPPDVDRHLKRAIHRGEIVWDRQPVADVIPSDEVVYVQLSDGAMIEADRVLLATGFESRRPGGRLVDSLVASASLPCAKCGYPIVDTSLRWHRRVYVTGPLAELEIGPISRNIAGARAAADRIIGQL
ncbi:MAG: FAD/NAD(P)-binding protein [Planctomycetota bacterium]